MRKIVATSLLCFTTAALAQQPAAEIPLLRVQTKVVVVDVVVTDRDGNPVRHLPQGAFTVLEDDKPQAISRFGEHVGSDTPPPIPPQPKNGPGIFSNVVSLAPDTPLTVVVLDTLNTPFTDQAYARSQLESFVKKMKPGSNIAIMSITTKLNLLQGFTSDPAVLQAALKRGKSMRVSPLREDNVTGGSDFFADQPTAGGLASSIGDLSSGSGEAQATRLRMRQTYTGEAFNQLARFLSAYPGRKNVIWFSAAFPIVQGPGGPGSDPFSSVVDFSQDVRDTSYAMSLAQVAVYPVDVRGVMTSPVFSAENGGVGRMRGSQVLNAMGNYNSRTAAEQMTMQQIAEDTGGKAYINNNDLAGAVRKAMNDGSNFYTIDYVPSGHGLDNQYHTIKVQLQAPGYKLSYRRGYIATVSTPSKKQLRAAAKAGQPAIPQLTPMKIAMQHGAPSIMQVAFRERFSPVGNEPGGTLQQTLAPGNSADPKLKGPYRQYELTFAIDAHTLAMPMQKDGKRLLRIEYTALDYGEDGDLRTAISNSVEARLTPKEYEGVLRDGLQLHQQISVPARGENYIRSGILDQTANTIGTLEIDAAQLKTLPPIAAVR